MISGKRILITRPPHQAQEFAERLRQVGAVPILLPLISIEPAAPLPGVSAYDWVIFTSANAVMRITEPAGFPCVAAVGTATAEALHKKGIRVDLIPAAHTAEALYAEMAASFSLETVRILLPQGDLARPWLAEQLRQTGARVDEVVVYRTVRPPIDPALLAQPFDVITFTSPSAVQHFIDVFSDTGNARIACIGPVTAAAAREVGLPVHMTAAPHTIEGLIQTMLVYFQGRTT